MRSDYSLLLRRCAAAKSLPATAAVHAHMFRSGFPHLALGNRLVDAYLKSGSLPYARRLFDEMPSPHIVSWNALLASYARRGTCPEAVSLYRGMLRVGVAPDAFTFSSLLTALTETGSLEAGRQVHAQLVVFAASDALFVSTALVNLYAKMGRPCLARLIFDRAPEKDVVLGTALVVGCARAGEPAEAVRGFADMRKMGVPTNEFTFASVLVACGDMEEAALGGSVHGLAVKSGVDRGSSARTSLIVMYSRCSRHEDSLQVYASMAETAHNIVAGTAAMGALLASGTGREREALSIFITLQRRDRLNEFALSAALRACARSVELSCGQQAHALAAKTGFAESHHFIVAALIDFYGKCGRAEEAKAVFEVNSERDMVAVNAMIGAYAACGRGREAVQLFDEAMVDPNGATYTAVLSACSAAGLIEDGRRIFSSIADPCIDHVACYVDLLARGGVLAEAEQVLASSGPVRDPVPWRTLLAACKVHGEVEMAERAAQRVCELSPVIAGGDSGSIVLLSNVYAGARRWRKAAELRRTAREVVLNSKEPGVSWVQ